jgi:FMN reductase
VEVTVAAQLTRKTAGGQVDAGVNVSANPRPVVLGIGGTTRANSSSERALRFALAAAERAGAETILLAATEIELPMYAPERPERTAATERLVREIARADGLVVSTPGYHGGISGLVKNALDYVEDLRESDPPYLDGRAVGCIVCAAGWQATASTLMSLRAVVHALRGWPTPLGVTINSEEPLFEQDGSVRNTAAATQLEILGGQVVEFARLRALGR